MESRDTSEPRAAASSTLGSEPHAEDISNAGVMKGQKCQFKAYRHVKKKDGSVAVLATEEPFKHLTEKDSAFALVINRYLDDKNNIEKSTLRINSFWIIKTLREVVVSYPGVSSDFTCPFDLDNPYQMLLHSWEKLDERRITTNDPDERMHLNFLFEFMTHEIGDERQKLMDMVRQSHVTFRTAWFVFRPGELLYHPFKGHAWILRCKRTVYEENMKKGPYLEIHCTYTDHDGNKAGRASFTLTLYQKEKFGGDQAVLITNLPIFPLSLARKDDDQLKEVKKRGERFLSLKDSTIVAYNGTTQYLREAEDTYYHPQMADFDPVWLPYTESGRLILDRKSFHEDMWCEHEFGVEEGKVDTLLCPPYTYAFSIAHKRWCRPLVDELTDVSWKQNVWDSLVISDSERQVLRALITSHDYPEDARDQTQLKGKGLVILLHGSPGSGKTLTAETAAEGCRRALVCTSLGELDKYKRLHSFRTALRDLLRLASVWKAVVLLDEADVLLEVRDDNQANRNAMVAVFLRELEYFSGIMFLTTNRVETFDKAMKSRIHLSLGYKPPGIELRRQIWLQSLKAIPAEENELDTSDLHSILGIDLNGREISNAINTARTLARFEKEPVRMQHIKSILDVRATFLANLAAENPVEDGDTFEPKAIRNRNSVLHE